jgi:ring-1,2-phenylacetyl-CoA epoxidase subunit PaaD
VTAINRDSRYLLGLLGAIADPEIPVVSIVDLGIVRAATEEAVVITPTYAGCPAMHAIESEIRATLDAHGYAHTAIRTTLSPPWTTEWMSAPARAALQRFGIAPPSKIGTVPISFPQCPQCGSHQTERLSEFGSTACKALYRCVACREPFDYFKAL